MKIIGLCGRSGSGKSYVCTLFERRGVPCIDTDALYRKMTAPAEKPSPCVSELAEAFGTHVVKEDNSLDREALRGIVFNDSRKLALLDRIAHKYILDETRALLSDFERNGAAVAVVDAPVLFESGFDSECDLTAAVVAPEDLRIERIIQRDGISRDLALSRLANQKKDEELIALCDLFIRNGGNKGEAERDVERAIDVALGKE